MATFVLDGGQSARLPVGAVTVSLHSAGNHAAARIDAMCDGVPLARIIRPTATLIVLPELSARMVLRVTPIGGSAAFAGSTSVSITLSVTRPGVAEPETIQVAATDVSGLTHRDLVVLELLDGGLKVSATGGDAEPVLPELATRARTAARQVLGVDRVRPEFAVNVVVAIDGSASMRGRVTDGSVAAVVEVIGGLSRAISASAKPVRVAVLGEGVRWIGDGGSGPTLHDEAAAAVEAEAPTIGFRSAAPGLRGLAPDENTVTFVVTDGIPADLDALVTDDAVDGEARHLVVIGRDGAGPSERVLGIPCTDVESGFGTRSLRAELLVDDLALRSLVGSLLVGCFAPETNLAERTGR